MSVKWDAKMTKHVAAGGLRVRRARDQPNDVPQPSNRCGGIGSPGM